MKNKHYLHAIIALLLLPSVVVGCTRGNESVGQGNSEEMTVDVARVVIDSVVVHKNFPGYISANKTVKIVARVNGFLLQKNFKDGEIVNQGDVLFRIEDTQYRDQLQEAQAQLSTAIATNEYATKHYQAMKKALESDAVSKMDVIQSESAMNESEASIESAKASVQSAKATLGYCTVVSPITGHIAAPNYTTGDYLSGDGNPVHLTTIYDDSKVKAKFSVDDSQYLSIVRNLKNGTVDYSNVAVSFNDTLPENFTGSLMYLAPNIVTNTGTIDLNLDIDNESGLLKDGMYALVHLPVASNPHAMLVNDASIGTDQLGKYLYIVNDSNKVEYRHIETGELVNDSMRIVTSGVNGDECYVTRALLKVRSGMTVNPRQVN
ncbi:MAG: efflux RND transporter periplasmic adaptor subunit [Clostridiales bacterium]|nr:efflux RND transporter periplasmic adaptor subunit [Clostridiales bacterium]